MKIQKLACQDDSVSLIIEERPMPVAGVGEVRIRVRAVSLNHRDLLLRNSPAMMGSIPVSDGSGEIDAIGPGVTRWRVGDRVMAMFMPEWTSGAYLRRYADYALGNENLDGMLAEQVVLPETALVKVPDYMSFEEAATLPCAGVSAWHGLVERGRLSAADTVLVQGTGGVALFGIQIAAALGVRSIITSSSDEKLARAKRLGANVGINYLDRPDWDEAVLEETGGQGVSHVLELGGMDTYDKSLKALGPGGKIVQIGVLSGGRGNPDLMRLQFMNGDIHAIMVGSGAHLEGLANFMEQHAIRPVIDRVFAFEDAEQAHEHLRSGKHFGKIVVHV